MISQLGTSKTALPQVSACGVTIKSPMEPGNDASVLLERFFWVYTDFYKWSTLSQHGKVALLLNVFADEVRYMLCFLIER